MSGDDNGTAKRSVGLKRGRRMSGTVCACMCVCVCVHVCVYIYIYVCVLGRVCAMKVRMNQA